MTNVLLVCHANTCRSVMAHVLLEKMLVERGTNGRVRVRSGGIANHARDGMIPSLDARIVLREGTSTWPRTRSPRPTCVATATSWPRRT